MVTFQFDGAIDYFELDPVACAPALGAEGVALYRARPDQVRDALGPEPSGTQRWSVPDRHERWVDRIERRLAVLDHDIEPIIRTHAGDRQVAAWFQDTAEAFEEIGEIDLAIDWARQALDVGPSHQSLEAADHWCTLPEAHRPGEVLDARLLLFRRWPSSATAARLPGPPARRGRTTGTRCSTPLGEPPRYGPVRTTCARGCPVGVGPRPLPRARPRPHLERAREGLRADRPPRCPARPDPPRRVRAGRSRRTALPDRSAPARKLPTLAAGSDHATDVDRFVVELRESIDAGPDCSTSSTERGCRDLGDARETRMEQPPRHGPVPGDRPWTGSWEQPRSLTSSQRVREA